jgi:hypothetical protein
MKRTSEVQALAVASCFTQICSDQIRRSSQISKLKTLWFFNSLYNKKR